MSTNIKKIASILLTLAILAVFFPMTTHAASSATVSDGIYTLSNQASGKMLNVYGGKDANGIKVTTWSYDGTVDQRVYVKHIGNGQYLLYAMCSSGGSNRVIDIYRGTSPVSSGQNVDIWDPNDSVAQQFYINPQGDGSFTIELVSLPGNVIAATDAWADGARLQLQSFGGSSSQKWYFHDTNGNRVNPLIPAPVTPVPVVTPPPAITPTPTPVLTIVSAGTATPTPTLTPTLTPTPMATPQSVVNSISDGEYNIASVASGKMINVNNGKDANGAKVTSWSADGSVEQRFSVRSIGDGKYLLYAMCSSGGNNRVLDIYRGNSPLKVGQYVDIWAPNDSKAQQFYIRVQSDGTYVLELAALPGTVIGCVNASQNGAQIQLQKYTGSNSQKWRFSAVNTSSSNGTTASAQNTNKPTPSATISLQQQKSNNVIAQAKALKQYLSNQNGGIQSFVSSNLNAALECYRAMLKCKTQTAWNNVTVDITAAACKATISAATVAISAPRSTAEAIATIFDTGKGVAIDAGKTQLLAQMDKMVPDSIVYSWAENAMSDMNKHTIAFVKLGASSDLNNYNDAASYIMLYQSIRMDLRTVRLGLDYFLANLKNSSSTLTLLKSCASSFIPDAFSKASVAWDAVNKLDSTLSSINIPCIRSYIKDMNDLKKETFNMISIS